MAQVTYTPFGGQSVIWDGQPLPGSANANPSAIQQYWNQWGGWDGLWRQGGTPNPYGGSANGGGSGNYNTGGGSNANPNTGGGDDVSAGFTPGGGSNPNTAGPPTAIGVQGTEGGGQMVDPFGIMDFTGEGNWQDYFQQQYPDTVIQNAIEAAGGSYNIADPVIQEMERMASGLTPLFALTGWNGQDVAGFDPFVTDYANAALGGPGGTASFGNVADLMGRIFGGGGPSDLMFAEAYGPRGARAATDVIGSMLGATLPFAMPMPLIGGVTHMLQQAENDYISNYVNSIGPGQQAMNFVDYLAGTGFGDIFGF